jgi:hypothetical protein
MASPIRGQGIPSSSRVPWSQVIPADGVTSEQLASVAQDRPAVMAGWESGNHELAKRGDPRLAVARVSTVMWAQKESQRPRERCIEVDGECIMMSDALFHFILKDRTSLAGHSGPSSRRVRRGSLRHNQLYEYCGERLQRCPEVLVEGEHGECRRLNTGRATGGKSVERPACPSNKSFQSNKRVLDHRAITDSRESGVLPGTECETTAVLPCSLIPVHAAAVAC